MDKFTKSVSARLTRLTGIQRSLILGGGVFVLLAAGLGAWLTSVRPIGAESDKNENVDIAEQAPADVEPRKAEPTASPASNEAARAKAKKDQEDAALKDRLEWADSHRSIETILLNLKTDVSYVPPRRVSDMAGGGMTSFGDDVLVLTRLGTVQAVNSDGVVKRMRIYPPDNGYDAYRKLSLSNEYKDYRHSTLFFRYNDILLYEFDGQKALAISYTEFDEEAVCYRTALATLAIDAAAQSAADVVGPADAWEVIYRTKPCLPLKKIKRAIDGHLAGGRMAYDGAGKIYLASGDYGWDNMYGPAAYAQDPQADYGKIIEIGLRQKSARHVAQGVRNPQGITIDPAGRIWEIEQSMRGGDELNLIIEGTDYGWPRESLGAPYNNLWVLSHGRHEQYQAPIFAWLPSIATSSLTRIDGFHKDWDGDFLVGTLKDRSLNRVRVVDGRAILTERIPFDKEIRYVHQHTDGRLVVLTEDNLVVFLTPEPFDPIGGLRDEFLAQASLSDDAIASFDDALSECVRCHTLQYGVTGSGPSLANIFGKPIASSSFGGYSDALLKADGVWTRDALRQFLKDPEAFAPGTAMPFPEIADDATIASLVDFIAQLNGAAHAD